MANTHETPAFRGNGPLTAQQREARKLRAWDGLASGLYRVEQAEPGIYHVIRMADGREARRYRVEWGAARKQCFCPDSEQNHPCKHLYCVWFHLQDLRRLLRAIRSGKETMDSARAKGLPAHATLHFPKVHFEQLYLLTCWEPWALEELLGPLAARVKVSENSVEAQGLDAAAFPYAIRARGLDGSEYAAICSRLGIEA